MRLGLRPGLRFALAWIVPGWVMFEAVPTKLPHYVLSAYPALLDWLARVRATPGFVAMPAPSGQAQAWIAQSNRSG